jgi:hypothetical protein
VARNVLAEPTAIPFVAVGSRHGEAHHPGGVTSAQPARRRATAGVRRVSLAVAARFTAESITRRSEDVCEPHGDVLGAQFFTVTLGLRRRAEHDRTQAA